MRARTSASDQRAHDYGRVEEVQTEFLIAPLTESFQNETFQRKSSELNISRRPRFLMQMHSYKLSFRK